MTLVSTAAPQLYLCCENSWRLGHRMGDSGPLVVLQHSGADSGRFTLGRTIELSKSVGIMAKNLQVVSFDSEWSEIYLGTVR